MPGREGTGPVLSGASPALIRSSDCPWTPGRASLMGRSAQSQAPPTLARQTGDGIASSVYPSGIKAQPCSPTI